MDNREKWIRDMGGFTTSLLPHQQAAVDKLGGCKVGALYMDMGTGKTRTTLEFVRDRYNRGKIDYVIWLCPCSVIQNLKDDIRFHCGRLPNFFLIKGIESISGSDKLYLSLLKAVQTHKCMLVVDESNLVKNPFSLRTKRITEISSYCSYKYILNGTPVSRNEADMFAQWYILDKRILGYDSYYSFAANHLVYREVKDQWGNKHRTDQIVRVLSVDYLTEKIAPYAFQIKKDECVKLPEKYYHPYHFSMTSKQEILYTGTFNWFKENVDDLDSSTIYKLFAACQHVTSGRQVLSSPSQPMQTAEIFDDPLKNPRIQCLDDVLYKIGDEQCIIFAKYTEEIDEITYLLDKKWLSHTEFTGRLNRTKREKSLEAFRSGEAQFLLANKMCGAYGLNLQFCYNEIFYSNDFQWATRQQAEDRTHRLGQTHDVHIYDIIAMDSIDEFIDENLSGKTSMVASFQRWIKKLQTKKELTPDQEHLESA